jgi:TPP-dependent pyruvate/acetoin dehydrogenase alpha subunit
MAPECARAEGLDVALRPNRGEGDPLVMRYIGMLRIRLAEEQIGRMFANGLIPGFIHLSIGQEAVPVGVVGALQLGDTLSSNHRGHGHAIAKGLGLRPLFAELMGRADGACKGHGGSMHVADAAVGMLGANGIVGGGIPLALGSAIAHQYLEREAIAVAFFGDGALAEGALHESLNMAALWKLPILFVCENNGWSEFSRTDQQLTFTPRDLVKAYGGFQFDQANGCDVEDVALVAQRLVSSVRSRHGPAFLECSTFRARGHYEGDAQKYRDSDELKGFAGKDPLLIAEARMTAAGTISAADLANIRTAVAAEIDDAVNFASQSSAPIFADAIATVYALEGPL